MGSIAPDTGIIAAEVSAFVITNFTIDNSKVNRDISESTLGPVALSREILRKMILESAIKDAQFLAALSQAQVRGYWHL